MRLWCSECAEPLEVRKVQANAGLGHPHPNDMVAALEH